IANLEREIKQLESKTGRTSEEERLLVEKKKKLEELLRKQSNTTNDAKPKDKTALYIGCGVVGVLVTLLIIVLARNQWLDKEHPKETRNPTERVYEIYINEQLEGELDLSEFAYGYEVNVLISSRVDEDRFQIINKPEKIEITKYEKYLNKQTIKKIEKDSFESSVIEDDLIISDFPQLEEIEIWGEKLTKLQISNCPQLTKLSCVRNNLTELEVSACPNLKELDCRLNLLTNLDLTNNSKLEDLLISNNNFSAQDLSFLSHLVDLKQLALGSGEYYLQNYEDERIRKGIYNRFSGSLETLKSMTKLEMLHIDNTDINNGVEYLSNGLAEVGLKTYEYDFADYLKKEKNLNRFLERCESLLKPEESDLAEYLQKKEITFGEAYHYIDQLRKEYRKNITGLDKIENLQKEQKKDFAINEEKEEQISEISSWKNIHPEFGNSDFAYYLKSKGYQDSQLSVFDLIKLQKRKEITKLDFDYKVLNGDLVIDGKLESLEKLNLTENSFSGSLEPLKSLTKLK
ncbi:24894_t:CDS:2, partial [Gigaspora margarita]